MNRSLLALCWSLIFLGRAAFASGILRPDDANVPPLRVVDHLVSAVVRDGIATTTIRQSFRNDTQQRLEATYLFPLPEEGDLTDFRLSFGGKMVQGEVLPAEKAAQIYEQIVRQTRDPGLIEFVGRRLLQMRIFPIEPQSTTEIQLEYRQVCRPVGGMMAYHYPLRTRLTAGQAYGTVRFELSLETTSALKAIWSPTHSVEIVRGKEEHSANVGYEASGGSLENDFLLLYATDERDLGHSVVAHQPSPSEPGHFVLLLTPRQLWTQGARQPQNVLFVLDTSGSMVGGKLEQARNALSYCVDRLDPTDRFTIVRFSTGFDVLDESLPAATTEAKNKAKEWIAGFQPAGGTNIADTLEAVLALHAQQTDGRPFVVVFLTDGQGNQPPDELMARLLKKTPEHAPRLRIFPFGIGDDVNTLTLDMLAESYTGRVTYVQPGENLELVVGDFFDIISRPILTDLRLSLPDIGVTERFPVVLGDLFHGQQLVVVGKFARAARGPVRLTARRDDESVEFAWPEANFTHAEGTESVPGIWAGRKIAAILDQVRQEGENDELLSELLALSQEFGIQTPYTSWFVNPEATRRRDLPALRDLPTRDNYRLIPGRRSGRTAPGSTAPAEGGARRAVEGGGGSEMPDASALEGGLFAASGASATRAAEDLAELRESLSADDREHATTMKRIGETRYFLIDGVFVDERVTKESKIIVIRTAGKAWFELAQREGLRPVLAIGDVLIVMNDKAAVLITSDADQDSAQEEFTKEDREILGLPAPAVP